MRNLRCKEIEADEIWCYVGKKQRNVTPEEKKLGELGDQYTFIALDPETKLIPVFAVGKRDHATTYNFVRQIKERVTGRIQLSTDAFTTYNDVVDRVFGANVDYAQVIKYFESDHSVGRYSPPKLSGIDKVRVQGNPRESRVSTSYVERNNLTVRMQVRRFTRLTNAFSKKLANLKAHLALHFAHYNFCRVHGSLRITPAMAAGITDHVWTLDELLD
jgi:IS1 family transposase